MKKVQEHDLYLNRILHHFDLKHFFLGWIIKKLGKGGPRGAPISLRSEYGSSNWFHCNTPNSRHLFNTNMCLIHFHSKNIIKMHFPKVVFLKFQTHFRHSLSIVTRWNKLHWQQQRRHNMVLKVDFLRKKLINNYYIYSSKFWHVFWYVFLNIKKNKNENWKSIFNPLLCTILSRMGICFFFRDKNWAAESVLDRPT